MSNKSSKLVHGGSTATLYESHKSCNPPGSPPAPNFLKIRARLIPSFGALVIDTWWTNFKLA